ncbi:hypothetical protein [Butyrivibrio sp. NC3005]|uniref:hypothetical protein n=1 Tax=Butyrivibrio sp. NC3005 TaxID=1280685 RepID=UPI000404CF3B|nr:hypothetical protein [Butyrivibrio sp. NC3005]
MEIIANATDILDSSKNYQLIKRYFERYYIRFEQEDGFICELPVSEIPTGVNVVSLIKDNPSQMVRIVNLFMQNENWTESVFIHSTITDCLLYSGDMPKNQASGILKKLSKYEDILIELYNMIVEEKTGIRVVKAAGYTAQTLMDITELNLIGAYLFLVSLRDDEKEALDRLDDMILEKSGV